VVHVNVQYTKFRKYPGMHYIYSSIPSQQKTHNRPNHIHNFSTPTTTRSMRMRTGTEPCANESRILLCMCTSAVVMSSVLIEVLASCIVLMVSCIFTLCIEIAKITLHSNYVCYQINLSSKYICRLFPCKM